MSPSCWIPPNVDADVVPRAGSLAGLLGDNAAPGEAARQLSEANINALEANGLFDVMSLKRVRGAGASVANQLAVAAELGGACTSTAWVQTLLKVTTWASARTPSAIQQETFGRSIFGLDPIYVIV